MMKATRTLRVLTVGWLALTSWTLLHAAESGAGGVATPPTTRPKPPAVSPEQAKKAEEAFEAGRKLLFQGNIGHIEFLEIHDLLVGRFQGWIPGDVLAPDLDRDQCGKKRKSNSLV